MIAAVSAGQAWAQGNEGQPAALEEIVVTAQRREENLQRVPVAVSAITAAAATKLGVTEPAIIAQMVPGLALNRAAQGLTPFLRGVGTNSSTIGNEPSVAMFIDDIYVPTGTAAVFDFNNISSVEVLKGPQGTLFGRNATGGVIHIHTKNPTFDPSLNATATYANYDSYSGQIYASSGLTENLAANIAAYASRQDKGWGTNLVNGQEIFKSRAYGVRVKAQAELSDATTLLLAANYDHRRSSLGQGFRVVPGTFTRNAYSPDAAGAGFYDGGVNIDQFYVNDYQQYSGKLSHDFGVARLVSITSWGKVDGDPSNIDIDASPTPFFDAFTAQGSKTFTQELQLLSPADSAMKWILGGFYLRDRSYFGATFVGQAFGTATARSYAAQKTRSISGFAQATAEILPRTNLTIGVRYTSDRRSLKGSASLTPVTGAATIFGPFAGAKTFSSLTGRFSLDHQFTDNVMAYVAYNRGFKSGIYNISGVSVGTTSLPPPVNPEDLNAYTAGFKSEFFDRRLRVNAEAYYYDYKNIQVQNVIPGGTLLTNGGAATIKGAELDISAIPVQNLTVNLSFAVADGHYDSFVGGPKFFPLPPNAPVVIPPGCTGVPPYPPAAAGAPTAQRSCDLSGNKTIQTPPFSATLSATYRVESPVGPLDLGASWSHGGNYFFEADNNPATKQHKTDLINASVQWSSKNDAYTVRVWGNNLGQEKYFSNIQQSSSTGAKYSPAAPRTYGVTLGANF